MDKLLTPTELKELVLTTSEKLKIKYPSVIEKDYYVTQVIHALSGVENEYFRLVFCGGTCLAKAHKIVKRMSEDVDFKIQIKNDITLSRSKLIKELKVFRLQIKSALTAPDFTINNHVVRNEGKYQRIELQYPTIFTVGSILRPHMLLEFTVSSIRLPTETLFVNTIIENTLSSIKLFAPQATYCVAIDETAAEKWVGLTRRVVAIERKYLADDEALIRHVYDLNAIRKANKITGNFFTLTKTIIHNDAQQFKTQHPEYFQNPSKEIAQSLTILKNKLWSERYQIFIDTMVYDNTTAEKYVIAMSHLETLSKKIATIH